MALDAQYIGTPKGYAASVENSTTAVDLVAGGTSGTRLENFSIMNNHTAATDVQVIHYDGATEIVILDAEVAAGEALNVLATLYGDDADKQYLIINSGDTIRVKTPTAVAGVIGCMASGGDF
ncbi:hypothetical protein [Desulfonema ishimotonii]|uniref:hypothetical protein n=1 Tax=Desulfonema ishimotonii TaxID=45657 RepID=UPI000F561AA3|nr:hypothetical protein [Desulfonema ishimotonii]